MAREQKLQQREALSMAATLRDRNWSSCSCSRLHSCHCPSFLCHCFSQQATHAAASGWAQHSWSRGSISRRRATFTPSASTLTEAQGTQWSVAKREALL